MNPSPNNNFISNSLFCSHFSFSRSRCSFPHPRSQWGVSFLQHFFQDNQNVIAVDISIPCHEEDSQSEIKKPVAYFAVYNIVSINLVSKSIYLLASYKFGQSLLVMRNYLGDLSQSVNYFERIIIYISIYTLSDLGDLRNLIGSLSRTIQQYSPPSEWIMCELAFFPFS